MKLRIRRGPNWLAARLRTTIVIEKTSEVIVIIDESSVESTLRASIRAADINPPRHRLRVPARKAEIQPEAEARQPDRGHHHDARHEPEARADAIQGRAQTT